MPPTLYILAGPNGAGKTTASKALLPLVFNTKIFINADIIAANLNPGNPEAVAIQAGRIMVGQIRETMADNKTFAIETTLATRSYLQLIQQAQLQGYEAVLYFFYLPSPNMARQRVKLRVSQGGHYIPDEVVERRYWAGIKNFFEYIKLVNRWYIYENIEHPPVLIARGEQGTIKEISNIVLWKHLQLK